MFDWGMLACIMALCIFVGLNCYYAGRNSNTKEATPSASHNKSRTAIPKGTCITCRYVPRDEKYLLLCNVDGICYEGEKWKPLETASVD